MNEFYVEQLVKKATGGKETKIKYLFGALTAVSVAGTLVIPILMFVSIGLLIADYFVFRRDNVEFEYLYLNGDLDIDKIIAKQKRKRVYTLNINDVVVMAHVDSPEVKPFQNVKVTDFSSGIPSANVYKAILSKNNQNVAVLIEPNETLIKGMQMLAPRKVFV